MSGERLVLFIDAQNFYNGARCAFFAPLDSPVCVNSNQGNWGRVHIGSNANEG
jgi:hypothetical protein